MEGVPVAVEGGKELLNSDFLCGRRDRCVLIVFLPIAATCLPKPALRRQCRSRA